MSTLEINNIKKEYIVGQEKFLALNNVSISFEKGELVSIVGESGSGKSTLMNIIGGLDSKFEGSIIVNDNDIHGLTESELDDYRKTKIGFVFQSFNLIPHISVLDNVTIAMMLANISEKERIEKATKILQRLGLEKHLKKKPNQLSGGQQQRVAIARALINNPDIILADEPTGALDSQTSMQILQILKEIADDGKLVIMVTHSEKVASISSRVVEISDGQIIRDEKNENYQKEQKVEHLAESIIVREKKNLTFASAINLSLKNMWAKKTKNILVSIGVAIGIMSLIIMLCFTNGLTSYVQSTMNQFVNPLVVQVNMPSETSGTQANPFLSMVSKTQFQDYNIQQLQDLILNRNFTLEKGFSLLDPMVMMPTPGYEPTVTLTLTGLEQSQAIMSVQTLSSKFTESNFTENSIMPKVGRQSGKYQILVSNSLQKKVDYNLIGSTQELKIKLGDTTIIENVEITGLIESASSTSNSDNQTTSMLQIYLNYADLLEMATLNNVQSYVAPTEILIVATTKDDAEKIKAEIKNLVVEKRTPVLDEEHQPVLDENENPTYTVSYYEKAYDIGTSAEKIGNMFITMIDIIQWGLIGISSITLLVSTIMILVVLYISVTERTKEIGTLKSIGARRKDIKRIFVSESFLIGVLSGIFAVISALILGFILNTILQQNFNISVIDFNPINFLIGVVISVVISMLAGLYPASKASKLDPVESLRRE